MKTNPQSLLLVRLQRAKKSARCSGDGARIEKPLEGADLG
jgi:hypothetical protein